MSRESSSGGTTLLFFYILASFALLVECQDNTDTNPALTPLITQVIYSRFSNLTTVFEKEIKESLSFCVKNVNDDWNRAFNFSNNMDFLSICVQKTQDLTQRICTAAEIKFYFQSFSGGGSDSTNSVQLNKNCNLASWVPGCEPGWACSVGDNQRVDLKNSKDIPTRGRNCQGCCAGFFCPWGITCMIPCPLGAYCPLAKLNKNTGLCDPYHYQLPPGQPNHTCGGADRWADVRSSRELFCSAGSYCPTTTEEIPCSSGHYGRTGSTSEKSCIRYFVTHHLQLF